MKYHRTLPAMPRGALAIVAGLMVILMLLPMTAGSAASTPRIGVLTPFVTVPCDLDHPTLSSAGHFKIFTCDSAGRAIEGQVAAELEVLWPQMTLEGSLGMGPPFAWTNGQHPVKIGLTPPSTAACFQATACSAPYNVKNSAGLTTFPGTPSSSKRPSQTPTTCWTPPCATSSSTCSSTPTRQASSRVLVTGSPKRRLSGPRPYTSRSPATRATTFPRTKCGHRAWRKRACTRWRGRLVGVALRDAGAFGRLRSLACSQRRHLSCLGRRSHQQPLPVEY